jgi:cytochrome c oxidase assembly protein subunit 15
LLAVWILWRLVWAALCVYTGKNYTFKNVSPFKFLVPFGVLVFTYGALVAGHKAGLIYNTFPLMGSDIFPAELGAMGWRDVIYNPVTVQFIHRWMAVLFVASIAIVVAQKSLQQATQRWLKGLLHLSLLQATLGITTLLLNVQMHVALCHQACGVLLILGLLMAAHTDQAIGLKR